MNNTEYTPSPKVAAMLAALAKKYKRSPLDDATLDTMCTVPEEQWPPELAEKVEALLKPEPKPAGGKPVVEVKALKITFTTKVGNLPPAPEPVPNKKAVSTEIIFQCKGDKFKAEFNPKSYRKALLSDPDQTAIIQGKLEGGKIIEAGITVALPKGTVPTSGDGGKEAQAKTEDV